MISTGSKSTVHEPSGREFNIKNMTSLWQPNAIPIPKYIHLISILQLIWIQGDISVCPFRHNNQIGHGLLCPKEVGSLIILFINV